MPLEIATFSLSSALITASAHPACHRIELCTNRSVGGLTPSLDDFLALRSHLLMQGDFQLQTCDTNPLSESSLLSQHEIRSKSRIPINVMIRPPPLTGAMVDSFTYSAVEVAEMLAQITTFVDAGADGFVFGALTRVPGGSHGGDASTDETIVIDEATCAVLITAARGRSCTFHRAFDQIAPANMATQLTTLSRMGFAGVLTSGGASAAVEGGEVLRMLVVEAEKLNQERERERKELRREEKRYGRECQEEGSTRIEIIVGGGVRSSNLERLRRETGARWYHSSAVVDDVDGNVADVVGDHDDDGDVNSNADMANAEEVGVLSELVGRWE